MPTSRARFLRRANKAAQRMIDRYGVEVAHRRLVKRMRVAKAEVSYDRLWAVENVVRQMGGIQ